MKLKKIYRIFAFVLILTLVTGTIPVSAANTSGLSLKQKSKIMYIGGAKGVAEDDSKASTKNSYRVTKLINGFDKDSMYIKLKAEDTTIVRVKNSKNKIYARKKVGSTHVIISVYDSKNNKLIDALSLKVRIRKNADSIRYAVKDSKGNTINLSKSVLGINVPYTVIVSNKDKNGVKTDTDKRRLVSDDSSISIKKANRERTKYTVKFSKTGAFTIQAGAYQSSTYNKTILTQDINFKVDEKESLVFENESESSEYYEVKFGMPDNITKDEKNSITLPETKMLKKGTSINSISTASMSGKMFLGWCYDAALTQMAGPNDVISRNMTLYPRFGSREGLDGTFSYDYVAKENVDANYEVLVAAHNLSATEVKNLLQVRDKSIGDEVIDFTVEAYNKSISGLKNTYKAYNSLLSDEALELLKKANIDPSFSGLPDLNKLYGLKNDDSAERYWREKLALEPDDVLLLQDSMTIIKKNAWNNINIYRIVPKSGKWTESHLQQVEITDTSCLRFVFEGIETEETIKYNNFSVYKEEYNTLSLDDSVVFIPINETEGINSLEGLLTFTSDGENQGINTGNQKGILKTKKELKAGTNIAVYDGKLHNNGIVEGNVGYFEITKVLNNGSYEYQSAEFMDVYAFPNVIPVKYNNNAKSGDIKISSSEIEFKGNIYKELKLDESTNVKEGDYIYFYSGSLPNTIAALAKQSMGLAKINKVTKTSDGISVDYTESSLDDLHNSTGMYQKISNVEIPVSKEDEAAIRTSMQTQMEESNLAQKTSDYIVDLINGDVATTDDPELDEALRNLTFKTDKGEDISIEELRLLAGGKPVEVSPIVPSFSLSPKLEHFDGYGMRAVVSAGFTIKIGLNGNNIIEIQCNIGLEQEVMLGMDISVGIEWEVIIPVDATIDASLRAGTYTGFGASATVMTKEENPSEDTEWSRLIETTGASGIDKNVEGQLLDLGTKLEMMSKNLGKIQGGTYTKDGLVATDDYDGAQFGTLGGDLPTKYAAMLENEADYVNIVDEEMFRLEVGLDPWQIIKFSISANLVVAFKLNAMIGFSISYGNAKQYCYHVEIKDEIAKSTTADVEAPNFRVDFFVFGMVGLRAGVKLDVRLGILSTKFASIGITAEAGLYAELYGFLYMFYAWRSGEGSTSGVMGSLLFEIGAYLEIKFLAQLGDGKLSKDITLYENQWPFLQLGATDVPVPHTYEAEDYEELQQMLEIEEGHNTVKVPDAVFGVDMMSLKDGSVSRESQDSKVVGDESYHFDINGRTFTQYNEEHFDVTCVDLDGENGKVIEGHHSFQYLPATNEIYIKPYVSDKDEFWGLVTFTYRNEAFGFSTVEIKRSVKVHWKGVAVTAVVEYYIQNDDGSYTFDKEGSFTAFKDIEYDLLVDEKLCDQYEGYRLAAVDYPGLKDVHDYENKLYEEMKAVEKKSTAKFNKAHDKWQEVMDKSNAYYQNVVDTIRNKKGTLYFIVSGKDKDTVVRLYFDKAPMHDIEPIVVNSISENDTFYSDRLEAHIYDGQNILQVLKAYETKFESRFHGYELKWYYLPVKDLGKYPKLITHEDGQTIYQTIEQTINGNVVHCYFQQYSYLSDEQVKEVLKKNKEWKPVTKDMKMPSEGIALIALAKDVGVFTITWKDENGNVIKEIKVKRNGDYGDPPYVTPPTRNGYSYSLEWSNNVDNGVNVFLPANSDITYTLHWAESPDYQFITWVRDNETWRTLGARTNEKANITKNLKDYSKDGYILKAYAVRGEYKAEVENEFIMPAGGITIKLEYTALPYNITWKDGDNVLKEETLLYGTKLSPPEIVVDEDIEGFIWQLDGNIITDTSTVPANDAVISTSYHNHDWRFNKTYKQADCTDYGLDEMICAICEKTKLVETSINPTYHDWDSTVIPGDCVTIGYTHNVCKKCGEIYDVNTGDYDYNNHKEGCIIHKDHIDPKCSDVGFEEGEYCTACNKYVSGGEVIPKLEHEYGDEYLKQQSTCTEGAIYAHKCNVCGEEIITKSTSPLGHKWSKVEYEWADDYSKVTATRICENDNTHIETETVETTLKILKVATCSEPGRMGYYATFKNNAFGSVSNENVIIPKVDHDWDTVIDYKWSDDNWKVTATRTCRSDSTHIDSETAETTYVITKVATSTEKGEKIYTAKFTNSAFEEITKTVEYDYEQVDIPKIQSFDPSYYNYRKGETAAQLKVNATVQDGGTLSYQWYYAQLVPVAPFDAGDIIYNPDDYKPKFTKIEGATSDTYTPNTNVELNLEENTRAQLYYYVEVTNSKNGSAATAKSEEIILYIDECVVITFDALGGTFVKQSEMGPNGENIYAETESIRLPYDKGEYLNNHTATPLKDDYDFMGWSDDKDASTGFKYSDDYVDWVLVPNVNTTYYAIWKKTEE